MKRLLLLAICALFALNADARTLYVDASRPNNKGNGRSVKKAKKTIQAAINVAKTGDTILVYPGTYGSIKTNNKKITIKSVKGVSKTTIPGKAESYWSGSIAELGKWTFIRHEYIDTYVDSEVLGRIKVAHHEWKGTASTLSGFRLEGVAINTGREQSSFRCVSGGTVKHCLLEGVAVAPTDGWASACEQAAQNTRLEDCTIENMYCTTSWNLLSGCTLLRCKVRGNDYGQGGYSLQKPLVDSSKCYNCLFSGNGVCGAPMFAGSVLVNCTTVGNRVTHEAEIAAFTEKSKFFNCILRNNRSRRKETIWVEVPTTETETGYYDEYGNWVGGEPVNGDGYWDESGIWVEYVAETRSQTYFAEEERDLFEAEELHNVDPGNVYKNTDTTNKNPKFTSAYKLKKGSYCINSGKLTKAQKKLVGTKDLAGRKRIRGKTIDRGCYEY